MCGWRSFFVLRHPLGGPSPTAPTTSRVPVHHSLHGSEVVLAALVRPGDSVSQTHAWRVAVAGKAVIVGMLAASQPASAQFICQQYGGSFGGATATGLSLACGTERGRHERRRERARHAGAGARSTCDRSSDTTRRRAAQTRLRSAASRGRSPRTPPQSARWPRASAPTRHPSATPPLPSTSMRPPSATARWRRRQMRRP